MNNGSLLPVCSVARMLGDKQSFRCCSLQFPVISTWHNRSPADGAAEYASKPSVSLKGRLLNTAAQYPVQWTFPSPETGRLCCHGNRRIGEAASFARTERKRQQQERENADLLLTIDPLTPGGPGGPTEPRSPWGDTGTWGRVRAFADKRAELAATGI